MPNTYYFSSLKDKIKLILNGDIINEKLNTFEQIKQDLTHESTNYMVIVFQNTMNDFNKLKYRLTFWGKVKSYILSDYTPQEYINRIGLNKNIIRMYYKHVIDVETNLKLLINDIDKLMTDIDVSLCIDNHSPEHNYTLTQKRNDLYSFKDVVEHLMGKVKSLSNDIKQLQDNIIDMRMAYGLQ